MSGSLICKSNFSVTMLFWWARSRTGTDWSTPRGWCWWTYSMTGAAPAPVWRLISRSSGSSPSWPRTGWCWPELAVITSRSWRHLGGIQDQLGQCSFGFNYFDISEKDKNLISFNILGYFCQVEYQQLCWGVLIGHCWPSYFSVNLLWKEKEECRFILTTNHKGLIA